MMHDARRTPDSDPKIEYSNQDWTVALRATLLALAPVALDLMAGLLEVARLFGIEFGLCSADFANENMEVGEDFIASDKSWESEFLDGHSTPPAERIARPAFAFQIFPRFHRHFAQKRLISAGLAGNGSETRSWADGPSLRAVAAVQ